MIFPPCPQDVELKFGTLCISFYRIRKIAFFLKPDLIPKWHLKPKALLWEKVR